MVTTANGGYYRFDGLSIGDYIVEVVASNFSSNNSLANLASSTGGNQEANPNMDGDINDNGIDTPVGGAIRSGIITLGGTEPTNEAEPGSYGVGSVTGIASDDNNSNLTVDFGFYSPCLIQTTEQIQNACIDNGTPTNLADDYYTVTLNATNGTSTDQYEVVINAAIDGTGGTVLGTATYGTSITVGDGSDTTPANDFAADGVSTYIITVRDVNDNTCFTTYTTTIVANCSSCPAPVCPPVQITINRAN